MSKYLIFVKHLIIHLMVAAKAVISSKSLTLDCWTVVKIHQQEQAIPNFCQVLTWETCHL